MQKIGQGKNKEETKAQREARLAHEAQLLTTRCNLCAEIHEGTFADGRTWYVEHLRKDHPDFTPVVRRKPVRGRRSQKAA
jgi:hypothetical protein